MQQEYVILVDQQDNEIGIAEKLLAHQQAQLHRAFSVFITRQRNQQLQILLQQRQFTKYHSPGLWTNTCCSHPMPGETTINAGQRRLQEEMGIVVPLQEIACFQYQANVGNGLIENEVDHVLIGTFEQDNIPVNQQEVADYRWIDATELQKDVRQFPEKYTAWFAEALDLVVSKVKIS